MSQSLLIVESPSKAKTLKKYLGDGFDVLASYGHVRDLVPKTGAVDPANNFAMKYQLVERNTKHVDALAKAVKVADEILIATDPDREGEAIAWHIAEILREKKLLKNKIVKRVVFYEITQSAVKEAIAQPRDIAMPLVNAQQARRALDYLVGFNLSPLLWRKIRRGLSAGRVQSPALATAAQMLQVHAAATLAVVAIAVTRQRAVRVWLLAASMLTGGAVLFALALALPPLAGMTLFPMAAPIGGSTMMVAWLSVAVAAAAEWRDRRN